MEIIENALKIHKTSEIIMTQSEKPRTLSMQNIPKSIYVTDANNLTEHDIYVVA